MRNLDFSSWQAILSTLFLAVLLQSFLAGDYVA